MLRIETRSVHRVSWVSRGYPGDRYHRQQLRGRRVVSCKLAGVDPFAYLRDVLTRVSTHPAERVGELIPREWQQRFAPPSAAATSAVARSSPPPRPAAPPAPPRRWSHAYAQLAAHDLDLGFEESDEGVPPSGACFDDEASRSMEPPQHAVSTLNDRRCSGSKEQPPTLGALTHNGQTPAQFGSYGEAAGYCRRSAPSALHRSATGAVELQLDCSPKRAQHIRRARHRAVFCCP